MELEIPYLGTVVAKGKDTLEFDVNKQFSEEAGNLIGSRTFYDGKKAFKQELNLGKIAEVCLCSREQVKTIL